VVAFPMVLSPSQGRYVDDIVSELIAHCFATCITNYYIIFEVLKVMFSIII